jgi:hypothetical protein
MSAVQKQYYVREAEPIPGPATSAIQELNDHAVPCGSTGTGRVRDSETPLSPTLNAKSA